QVQALVDQYVNQWRATSGGNPPDAISEESDFGFEDLQVFRNGFSIDTFTHHELCELSWLLTRSLGGPVNSDHKLFWAWTVFFVTRCFKREVTLFQDREWDFAVRALVNLVLSSDRDNLHNSSAENVLQYVNSHLLTVSSAKWQLSAPFSYNLLEG